VLCDYISLAYDDDRPSSPDACYTMPGKGEIQLVELLDRVLNTSGYAWTGQRTYFLPFSFGLR
jgi:hypothetical protein